MRMIWLAAWLCALSSSASAAPRELSLQQAVELAFRRDPGLSQARLEHERASWQSLRAQLDRVSLKVDGSLQTLFNKANIGGPTLYQCMLGDSSFRTSPEQCSFLGGTATRSSEQRPERELGSFSLEARLNVPLFAGFRVQSNVERTRLLEDASVSAVRQARKEVALAVMRAYWQLRRVDLLLEVQETSLARQREAEAVVEGRVRAGLAPPVDRNRASLRRLQTAATLADLNGQRREAAVQLAVALEVDGELLLTDDPRVPDNAPAGVDELLSTAQAGRPELRTLDLQLQAQHQALRIARSAYYPQLSAFGSFEWSNNPFNYLTGSRTTRDTLNPFNGMSANLTAGLLLTVNLFDTLNTYTQVEDARLVTRRMGEQLRQTRRVVTADVRNAHARLTHLYERRVPLVEALEVARDNLKILEARYTNGEALVIEYLEGQNDLVSAEQQVVDVTAQLQQAWYELEASLGRVVGVDR